MPCPEPSDAGSTLDVRGVVAEIDAALRERGTTDRARHEKAYLKSDLTHYGVPVPVIRSVVKSAARRHPALGHDDLVALVGLLWREPEGVPVHERRMAAVELLALHPRLLDASDLPLLERLLRESRTWALVDGLAANVVGGIVERAGGAPDDARGVGERGAVVAVLDRWSTDDDFWVRRAALLAHLVALRNGRGDFTRFARYADAMLDEKEFFIRKAIGWVLRDTARKRPQLVYEWLLPRAARASGVTVREAVKHLDAGQRAAILAAR